VTYGDLGSAAFNREGQCLASAPVTKCLKLVDTVGAGDAFSSVMLLALTQQWPIDIALQRANQFASDICGIRGATPPDLTFYQKYVNAWKN
jgi:fructokinase